MFDLARQPLSGTDMAAFTFGALAILLAAVWRRERQPGLLGFACAFAINMLLAAFNDRLLPSSPSHPNITYLLLSYLVHTLYAVSLVDFLRVQPQRRPLVMGLLAGPIVIGALLVLAGVTLTRPQAVAPLLLAGVGCCVLTLMALSRERGAGLELLASAALVGPLFVLWRASAGGDLYAARYYAWPPAIAFGVTLPVVSLMRKQREARRAQRKAARVSTLYGAVSKANSLIARGPEPQALYEAICDVCVSLKSVRYACITEMADGVGVNVAWAGDGAQFFGQEGIDRWRLDDRTEKGAITAQALAEAHPVVCNDYLAVAEGEWREAAVRHGIASIAVFPFRRGGRVAGALTIFDPETDAFDPELTRLFAGLAVDIGFALDNHDQRIQREQALAEERAGFARFQKLFQSAPLLAVILRLADRQVVDINDTGCLRLAVQRGEAMGLTLPGIGIGQADERYEAFFENLQRGGQVRNMETTLHTVQGPRAALLNAEVIDYQGERCVLAMALDIADLRAAEEARRELAVVHAANAAKTDFLSRVSHELRTPMNAVLGFAQLMRNTGAGRLLPSDMDRLDHILQAGTHLLKLIDDVLDVSRIEAGRMHVETTGVPLKVLLDQALGLVLPLAARHAVQVNPAYRQEAPAAALADETRLRQVVTNLLSNAIKYNRPAGHVRLALHVHATTVELVVEDTGLGMTPEQLRQLYEPFNRLGRERGGIEGTGIGLALTRQLVTLMRGTLQIDSTAGVGTRAVVTLPRAPMPGANEPNDELVLAPSHQGTVLYIEDNPINVMLVEAMLDGWPEVKLVGAELGARGIAQARALKPDLVLLDMQLPDMSGLEVIRALRSDPDTRDLRIVVLSASAMPEEVDQARSAGADDYWTKPLDYAAFLDGVGRMLASAQA